MSGHGDICAYYSPGPHFRVVLEQLRQRYPTSPITAVAPSRYPRFEAENLVWTEAEEGFRAHRLAFLRFLRRLRAARYGVLVVMFDTPRLRLFAALSGAKRCACVTADGRFLEWKGSVLREAGLLLLRELLGRVAYLILWLGVHLFPTKPDWRGRTDIASDQEK